MKLIRLSVEQLMPGRFQPRRHFHKTRLQELADSIQQQGIIEPLVVQLLDTERYEILAGERRWRAAMLAGLQEVPCILGEYNAEQAAAVTLLENLQREDLTPLEESQAYLQLMQSFSYTQNDLANILGKSRSHIANFLRLLQLCEPVQAMVHDARLSFGHARCLVGLEHNEQVAFAEQSIKNDWSVRLLERAIRQRKQSQSHEPKIPDEDMQSLQYHLSDYFATPVQLEKDKDGGWLRVRYYDNDNLEGLLSRMGFQFEDYEH